MSRDLKGSTSAPNASDRLRVGDVVFDPATGEIAALGTDGVDEPRRLAPQPARLLALLIEHRGELVDQQQIRDHLWPEVKADVDQNLHFCVRQVRAALEDSASVPRYIETLPRRGYRLVAEVEPWNGGPEPTGPEPTGPEPTGPEPAAPEPVISASESTSEVPPFQAGHPSARRGWPWLVAGAALGLILTLGWIGRGQQSSSSAIAETSLAITSFQPGGDLPASTEVPQITDHLLARLGGFDPRRLGVIGPTTTAPYGTDLRSVHRMVVDLEVDYVINGRWSGEPSKLLIEVIRASDGHHVWVQQFEDLSQWQNIADLTADAVLGMLFPDAR